MPLDRRDYKTAIPQLEKRLAEIERVGKESLAKFDLLQLKSIASVTNYYLATSASSGVTRSTPGWTTTIQSMTATNQYLWTYEVVTGSDGSTLSKTDPVIIGRYGQNGSAGKGITSIVEWYQISASSTTPPATPTQAGTGYSSTPVATTSAKPYLWNYEVISYTSGSPTITAARVIGTHGATGAQGPQGDDGQPGADGTTFTPTVNAAGDISWENDGDKENPQTQNIKGPQGDTGVSVTSVSPQYYLSTSSTVLSGGSWDDAPQTFVDGYYYWTREKTVFSDGITDYSTGVYNAGYTQAAQDALNAKEAAEHTAQYFWFNSEETAGEGAGAHITEKPQAEFVADPANGGFNLLAQSVGVLLRSGLIPLARFGPRTVIGDESGARMEIKSESITAYASNGAKAFEVDSSGAATLIETTKQIPGVAGQNNYSYTIPDTLITGTTIDVSIMLVSNNEFSGHFVDFDGFVYQTAESRTNESVTVAYNGDKTITVTDNNANYKIDSIGITYTQNAIPSRITAPYNFTLRSLSLSDAIFEPELTAAGLTAYSSRANYFDGGYIRIGAWCYVSFSCEIRAALSANDYWGVINGFPEPFGNGYGQLDCFFFDASASSAAKLLGAYVNENGRLVIITQGTGLAAGDSVQVSGWYLAG